MLFFFSLINENLTRFKKHNATNINEDLKNKMELDYWGLSYQGALEYILNTNTSENIVVSYETGVCKDNVLMFSQDDRKRLSFTKDVYSADYFITNYRWHMIKDSSFSETLNYEPVYDLKIGKSSIMSAWKIEK